MPAIYTSDTSDKTAHDDAMLARASIIGQMLRANRTNGGLHDEHTTEPEPSGDDIFGTLDGLLEQLSMPSGMQAELDALVAESATEPADDAPASEPASDPATEPATEPADEDKDEPRDIAATAFKIFMDRLPADPLARADLYDFSTPTASADTAFTIARLAITRSVVAAAVAETAALISTGDLPSTKANSEIACRTSDSAKVFANEALRCVGGAIGMAREADAPSGEVASDRLLIYGEIQRKKLPSESERVAIWKALLLSEN